MKLKLFYEGESKTVTSETAAKAWARQQLGVKKLYETPTENGWQYWASGDENDDEPVTVIVI